MADSVPQRVAVGAWDDRWRADARAACVRRCEAAAAAKGTAALDLRGVHMRELSASLLELQLGALNCDEATVRFMRCSDAEALGPIAGTTQLDVAALCEHLQTKRSSARQRLAGVSAAAQKEVATLAETVVGAASEETRTACRVAIEAVRAGDCLELHLNGLLA